MPVGYRSVRHVVLLRLIELLNLKTGTVCCIIKVLHSNYNTGNDLFHVSLVPLETC